MIRLTGRRPTHVADPVSVGDSPWREPIEGRAGQIRSWFDKLITNGLWSLSATASVAAVVVALAFIPPPAALAEPVGVISGKVVNRTASGGSVAGAEARLFVFRQQTRQAERIGAVAEDGTYRFEGLETAEDYSYQVMALYGGLPYGTDALTFAGPEREQSADIDVYESTDENPGIYAVAASLIIAGADPATQSVLALEIVELVNPSDRTYRPTPTGPQGPMGLVRFSLPPGATDLTAHIGLAQEDVIQVDRGFATMAPILPGSRELMYAYRFPYTNGAASFNKNLLYGAKIFTLLTVEGAGQVSSPQLTPQERAEIQGNKYVHFQGTDLAANTSVDISLTGLPQPAASGLPFGDPPAVAWAGAGIVLAVSVVAVVALRRPGRALSSVETGSVPNRKIQELLDSLAGLDDDYAAGAVAKEEYEEQRAVLREYLKELVRTHDVHLLEGIPAATDRERPGGH